jgi:glycosyltransferase involved in cell wall biosynthesis
MPKLLLSVNSAWNVANFRAGLVRALQAGGWEVTVAAPADDHVDRVRALGCRYVGLPMDSGGTHPWRDLRLYQSYRELMQRERPAAFLGFTIKPNVYGSLAAHRLGIPVINNVAGLGTAFVKKSWLTWVARFLYRMALRDSHRVLFQNEDDRRYFADTGLVDPVRTDRVPGSGIDLEAFAPTPLPPRGPAEPLRFLFVGRLLRDKGVVEFVEAARCMRLHGVAAEFAILGPVGVLNPTAVSKVELDGWVAEGVVEYLGVADDVRPFMRDAHCIVLPSAYREGVPRTLLEAASLGRPLIATDAIGCRDVVEDGVNGFLVRVGDVLDLVSTCERLVALPQQRLHEMGRASRAKVVREFDERFVFGTYLRYLEEIQSATRAD